MDAKKITIFEGPDGSGKSTAAKAFAAATGALHVHHGAYPTLSFDARFNVYAGSMLPALQHYSDVVLDRSWYSEVPYGTCGRDAITRLPEAVREQLDFIARQCQVAIVLCLPELRDCINNFNSRRHEEYLESHAQFERVYAAYIAQKYNLPMIVYNYTIIPNIMQLEPSIDDIRSKPDDPRPGPSV